MKNRKLKNEELNRLSEEEFKTAEKNPILIVLDNIRSLNNIGSVFRTADAFCVEAIYLCGFTAQPPHRDINKTALGATETVEWKYFPETIHAIEELKEKGYEIVSVEQAKNTVFLNEYFPSKKTIALVFGNEVKGVAQEVINQSDVCLEVPQWGTKHSLNISVCVGVVVWDLVSKSKKLR